MKVFCCGDGGRWWGCRLWGHVELELGACGVGVLQCALEVDLHPQTIENHASDFSDLRVRPIVKLE